MIIPEYKNIETMINSPVRHIKARVELLEGSALLNTFTYEDRLISFTIDRVGEGKFFGFGICQKANIKLIDTNRELDIKTSNTLEILLGVESDYIYPFPLFKVSEVHRNENTNELSITAYDALYQAAEHTAAELQIHSYTLETMAAEIAALLGLNCRFEGLSDDEVFYTYYETGANLDGSETLRELLDSIAEATQTIYFVNSQWELVFKRMDRDGNPALIIDKEKYISLDSKTNRRLAAICSVTELGDNVTASIAESGSTQYLRDNPFLELRTDIGEILNSAIASIGGFTINQFECNWRGNYLLEIGDKLGIVNKDNEIVYSYLLDDVVTYDGKYSQKTQWSYKENETESESNPTSLGDALKQTYARVDKANKQIEIVASDIETNTNDISSLMINTESINLSVKSIEERTNAAVDGVKEDIETINKKVAATMTADDIKFTIESELENGVDKVVTNTGFTFNDEGLTVSKSDCEMTTQITENGMTVYKSNEAVLVANNNGVDAVNLHATTYLIIGNNSRFEDYGNKRIGCFWIGEGE